MLKPIAKALALALLAVPATLAAPAVARPVVEIGFVLDTTGSMGPLIEGAKRKIWSIATSVIDTMPDADIRMGLVAYRDIGDEYVTKRFDLTTDIQDLYAQLLELKARGGGDWPESVNEALYVGVTKLSWSSGEHVSRILFLVGDAPPHMDYAQDMKYHEVLKLARRKGIVVNAVQAGDARDTKKIWKEIAQMGDGEYIAIPQDGGRIVMIETPYDRDIVEMQGQINGTVIPYGSRSQQERVRDKVGQVRSAPAPAASDMASYMNKRAQSAGYAAEALTGSGDLVADVAAGRQDLSAVKDEELPAKLRAMEPAERRAYLDARLTERKALQEKLNGLVKKRDAYVAEQRAKAPVKTGDSFDRAVESTLKAQIKR